MKLNRLARTIAVFLAAVVTVFSLSAAPVFAEGLKVTVDGAAVNFDVEPVNVDGRVMVPVAAIFNAMGCDDITWDSDTQEIIAIFPDKTTVKLTVGETTAYVGDKQVTLDVAPSIIDGRTMVPTRFIAESANATVEWDEKSQTVVITANATEITETRTVIDVAMQITGEVKAGNKATLELEGKPNVTYSISVVYSSGPSTAAGLVDKTAGADGKVAWSWLVGSRTKAGAYDVVVTDQSTGNDYTITFTVTN